jgi:hypothetical protein
LAKTGTNLFSGAGLVEVLLGWVFAPPVLLAQSNKEVQSGRVFWL